MQRPSVLKRCVITLAAGLLLAGNHFLCGLLTGKNEFHKTDAIRALGQLEDPKAIAILESLEETTKDTSLQKEAQWAVSTLRWGNKPHDNLKDLRQEVIDLQKSNREMKKEIEELKQKFKALKPTGSKTASSKSASSKSGSTKEAQGSSTAVRAERLHSSKQTKTR